ncbi:MAG: F0F1 ATP synthase subunit B [Candidatus Bipolaricaulota bacterium]
MTIEWGKILELNVGLILQLANFAILMYFLNRWLFKPAMKYLDRRRERIAAEMESARVNEARAAELVAEREREFREARERAAKMIDDAQAHAEATIEESKTRAKEEAARIVEGARRDLEKERDEMIRELRARVADIALLGARTVLDREVRAEDHRRFLDRLVEELDEATLGAEKR